MVTCKIYDLRIFTLSIFSIVGWIVFSVSFGVLLNDYSVAVFAGTKDINAITFVHFCLAFLGWVVNVLSLFFAVQKGRANILGTLCVFSTALLLIIAGGVANDYGRAFYTLTLGGEIDAEHFVPQSLTAAMAGVCIFTASEAFKLLCFFHRYSSGARNLPYTNQN